jgi:hypothetical protein
MELKDFVSGTIKQIISGIKDAQNSEETKGSRIIPIAHYVKYAESDLMETETGAPVFYLEFDVAITASEGTQTKGGISVLSGVINLGSQGQSLKDNTTLSHIKFEVPIIFPTYSEKQ